MINNFVVAAAVVRRTAAVAVTVLAAGLLALGAQGTASAAPVKGGTQVVVTPLTNDWGLPKPVPGN
ncbi:hypothetical protein ABT160_29265 [Streptomyces sp. NPDC001941]|uniref:hypothetical protein n=1 Tax=Streptomyces sp. NPDC001941 TaxID=3154659 RepID=UPI00331D3CDF